MGPTGAPSTMMPTGTTDGHLGGGNNHVCDPNKDDFEPNLADCTTYFICTKGHAFKVQCAQGLTFNAVTKACDWPINHSCKLPSGAPTAPASVTTTTPQPTTTMPTTAQPTTAMPTISQPSNPASTMQPTTPQPTTQQPTTPKPTTQKPINVMSLCRDNHLRDGIHKDPTSCRHFIECVHHNTVRLACPPGTGYDARFKICDYTNHIRGCH